MKTKLDQGLLLMYGVDVMHTNWSLSETIFHINDQG